MAPNAIFPVMPPKRVARSAGRNSASFAELACFNAFMATHAASFSEGTSEHVHAEALLEFLHGAVALRNPVLSRLEYLGRAIDANCGPEEAELLDRLDEIYRLP